MFCKNCGKQLKDGALFCTYCGTAVKSRNAAKQTEETKKEKKNGKKTGMIIEGIVVAVLLLTAIVFGAKLIWNRLEEKKEQTETEEDWEETEKSHETEEEIQAEAEGEKPKEQETEEQETEEQPTDTGKEEKDSAEETEDSQEEEWKQAYIERFQQEQENSDQPLKTTMIYLDKDDVPECIIWSSPYNSSTYRKVHVLSYQNGTITEFVSEEAGWQAQVYFTEKTGKFMVSEVLGLRSAEWWEVVDLVGNFEKTGSAWTDNDMEECYYQVKDKDVTQAELSSYLNGFGFTTVLTSADYYASVENAYRAIQSKEVGTSITEVMAVVQETDDVFPNSSTAYLTEEEVRNLTPEELRIARNEIYARHGYIFKDEQLKAYFEAKPWYEPMYDVIEDSMFNDYELTNRDLIVAVEEEKLQ